MNTHNETTVPVLLTGDVDYSTHHRDQDKKQAFEQMLRAGRELAGSLTFFFVAKEAQQVPEYPRILRNAGHEIACHGLTHGNEEEYDSMPLTMQEEYLKKATGLLSTLAGCKILSFRGPRVKISGPTLKILSRMGYVADSTVCSQRCDLISSNLLHTGWLRAPRHPYHPSEDDAYGRGGLGILEVPVSALALPFISSTLYVLGLQVMKMLFRALYVESRRTGKPIVYLFHPYEFADEIKGAKDYSGNLKVHGLRLRRHLYRGDSASKLAMNLQLWRFMAGFEGVRFITVSQYAGTQAVSVNEATMSIGAS
ncbi:MAG: polysaccharide deacetylase family protein [Nitrospira sp.]|nr:polysaccharide deacetylase family protein [Nitrospira sp.]